MLLGALATLILLLFLLPLVEWIPALINAAGLRLPLDLMRLMQIVIAAAITFKAFGAKGVEWAYLAIGVVVLLLASPLTSRVSFRPVTSLLLLRQFAGDRVIWAFSWLLLGLACAFLIGRHFAATKSGLAVLNTNPPMVVFRIYENQAIGAPFGSVPATVQHALHFVTLGEDPSIMITGRKVGPVTLVVPTSMPTTQPQQRSVLEGNDR